MRALIRNTANKTADYCKNVLINSVVFIIILCGFESILFSLPHPPEHIAAVAHHYAFINPQLLSIHRAMSAIIGFILIFISYKLYKRMRMAWFITLSMLHLLIVLRIFRYHQPINVILVLEIIAIIILVSLHRSFSRVSSPIEFRWGMLLAAVSMTLVIFYTALGFLMIKTHFRHIKDFGDSVSKALELLFYMDVQAIEPKTKIAVLFAESSIILNWSSILLCVVLIFKPLIYQPFISKFEREKVRHYLKLYGSNPISYVAVEHDKKYFFGTTVDGVIVYVITAGVAVCAGGPLCKEEEILLLVNEFTMFCRQNDLSICFCQASCKLLKHITDMGFGITKYGEEALFDLQQYKISGGKTAKIRQAVHNADREGIRVFEYKPHENRNKALEEQIMEVSREWLSFKKSGELSFMLGSVNLDNPMDRRYFLAADANDRIQAFIVFVPYNGGEGYYTDVTRRRKDAPAGTMEKIVVEGFMKMKEEGIRWGSMGLVPLAGVRECSEGTKAVSAVLEFIYENMNRFYGFKTLHRYKKKYAPTIWETRYLVYLPGIFTPKIAYAIIKAQNPKGVKDYVLQQIKLIFNNAD